MSDPAADALDSDQGAHGKIPKKQENNATQRMATERGAATHRLGGSCTNNQPLSKDDQD